MSVGGLGAFAQGLVQGYQVGDRLKTAEEDRETSRQVREMRGLQIAEEKRKATERQELDALRPQMSQAIGQMLANPTDDAVVQNYNDVMAKYYTKANPNEAVAFVKSVKEDKLKEGARQAANIFGRLQLQDPTAIVDFAKAYKAVPSGVDVDPARSGFTKDGGIQLGLFNTQTGEALPNRVVTRDQVVQGFAQFLSNPKDVVDFYQNNQRMALTVRGQDMEYDLGNRGLGLRAREAAQRDENQDIIRGDRALETDLRQLDSLYRPRYDNIKNNFEQKYDARSQAEALSSLESRRGIVESVVRINREFNRRVPISDVWARADEIARGEGVTSVPKGMEKSGYGLHRDGYLVPLAPNARVKPKQ